MRPIALIALLAAMVALVLAAACGEDGGAMAEADGDVAHTDDTAVAGDGAADDAPGEDTAPACQDGAWTCSDDAATLTRCDGGELVATPCDDAGLLCDEGSCVPPWRWRSPAWGTCPDGPSTAETLAQKAAWYDAIAVRLHVHPALKWIATVRLAREAVPCEAGEAGPCFAPLVPEAEATWQDVDAFETDANDGLWNALYMASQAYRYAVTRDPEVLAHLIVLLEGEVDRMAVTGVPGLFARRVIPPGVAGLACPSGDAAYTTDPEKDDDRWVRVGAGGCVEAVDHLTGQWFTSDTCGLDAYAGWCWYDNVSQDEYAGHMYALGAIALLVDDPAVQATAAGLLEQVGLHLRDHGLTFVDWDGRVTEHGAIGLAAMALGWVKTAAVVSGNAELDAWYRDCLLQESGPVSCVDWLPSGFFPMNDILNIVSIFAGLEGCKSNWNSMSMTVTALQNVLWFERDPLVRGQALSVLDEQMMRADHPKAMASQHNPWWNFVWASMKPAGPDSDGPALAAVEEGVCALRRFPASSHMPDADSAALYPHHCDGRLDASLAAEVIPPEQRCPTKFLWWFTPYKRETCTEQTWRIVQPQSYLLPYWMGRYFGFIAPDA